MTPLETALARAGERDVVRQVSNEATGPIRASTVFDALYGELDGYIELRALPSGHQAFARPGQYTDLSLFVHEHEAEDLYFGVAMRATTRDGTLPNCSWLSTLFGDLDGAKARAQLARCPLEPSLLVKSGGDLHLHAYWFLKEPVNLRDDLERVEHHLKGLQLFLGADPKCVDGARILRLPNTHNHKYTPARLVAVELFAPDHRYTLADFDPWLPEVPLEAPRDPLNADRDILKGDRNDTLYRLGRALRAKKLPEATILATLHTVNKQQCKPPLSAPEMADVCKSVLGQADRPDFAAGNEEHRIAVEMARERAKREARRRLDAEERGPTPEPDIRTLRARLADPSEPTGWRIHGWQPRGSRVILAAQFKAGKTTLVGNAIRSLVDGEPWLDVATVVPIMGSLALVDVEMGEHQLDAWLQDQGIRGADRVLVIPLRGRAATFDILDARISAQWVARFREHHVSYLVLDCLRPCLDALGLDEHHDAGRFLVAFDALLKDAGITDALITHHMGHLGERSRGDSRLRDWPDIEWRLVRQDNEPASARFITAYGRDVDVPESQLVYDPGTRHLTIAGGSRRDVVTEAALADVLTVLDVATKPPSGRALKAALAESDHTRAQIEAAIKLGVRTGAIIAEPGPRHSRLYRRAVPSVSVSQSVPAVSQDSQCECPVAYRARDTARSLFDTPVSQDKAPFHFDPREAFGPREEKDDDDSRIV